MAELALEKIKIRSAILQEFLLRLSEENKGGRPRGREKHEKPSLARDEELPELERKAKAMAGEAERIEPVIAELKGKRENLSKRDKVLEGRFQAEFNHLKQPVVEYLLRHYKKRPVADKFRYLSATCLEETSLCLITNKASAILPQEYQDFLRNADTIDAIPSNLPGQIDNTVWRSFCKLRRNKVELEMKVRYCYYCHYCYYYKVESGWQL